MVTILSKKWVEKDVEPNRGPTDTGNSDHLKFARFLGQKYFIFSPPTWFEGALILGQYLLGPSY